MIGLACGTVGQMPTNHEPYDYMVVITLGAVMIVPTVLGYLAGQDDRY